MTESQHHTAGTMMEAFVTTPNGDHVVGYRHQDARGWAAWDRERRWLGKSDRSRFVDAEAATAAIRKAYREQVGRDPADLQWRPAMPSIGGPPR